MKTAIHPKYLENMEIRCSCGNVMVVGSTKEKMKTELCSKCHPFYTGQQKLVDTAGRVDKFQEKRKKFEAMKEEKIKHDEEKKKKPEGYKEKEVSAEVLARAMGTEAKAEGKWAAPLGETASEQEVKDEIQVEAEETRAPKAKKVAKEKKAKKAE